MRARATIMMLVFAMSAAGAACAGNQGAASGELITPAEASKTVVLHAQNLGTRTIELHAVQGAQSEWIGSVDPGDSTVVLLDPTLFPTGQLYLIGIPGDNRGRAVVGPLAAGKGDHINLTLEEALGSSHAIVVR